VSEQLVLPGIVTPTSWTLPTDLTFEQWERLGQQLRRAAEAVMWWLGDWWAYGEHRYGDRAQAVREGFGWSFQTCMDAAWVARKFETSRRREVLSWSHHKELAGLTPVAADELLDLVEAEGWARDRLRTEVRRRRLAGRLGLAAAEAPTLAAIGRFQILYADPPWQYENPGPSSSVEDQYETMDFDELAALGPDLPAADDSILFLWSTNPKMDQAIALVDAWGFRYRTAMVWIKDSIGLGYFVRARHEVLLIAKRGSLPLPADNVRPDSVLEAPRREHSQKPEEFYDVIETMYPGLAYVELFARTARPGWVAWGNQVPA
jgi:N6-adenosine-specific RNA methylase IME4